MRIAIIAVTVILLLTGAAGAAELYRYTDERGVVHFVGSLNEVPERFRPDVRPVKGNVSRPGAKAASTAASPLADLIPETAGLALPPALIVLIEAWRTRLFADLLLLAAFLGMFLLGLRYARDIPKAERGPLRLRLALSLAVLLALLWLSLLGPGLGRMLRGCEAEAERNQTLAEDDLRRARLETLERASGRAAEQVERVILSPPV